MTQVTYILTAGDVVKAHTLHGGTLLKVSQAFGALMIAAGVTGCIASPGELQGSIITIFFGFFLFLRVHVVAWLQYRRDLAARGEIRLNASNHGIEIHTASSTAQLNWAAFRRYSESPRVFLLYTQSNCFQVVPKRVMAADAIVQFRELLAEHLGRQAAASNKKMMPQLVVLVVVIVVVLGLLAMVIARRPA